MWALIIHLDSEGIDPLRWQNLDSWEGWRTAPTQCRRFWDAFTYRHVHEHALIKIHQISLFLFFSLQIKHFSSEIRGLHKTSGRTQYTYVSHIAFQG